MRIESSGIALAADEQVTLVGAGNYDIVRKSWGYYGTPSMNQRLVGEGLRAALTLCEGHLDLILVSLGREKEAQDDLTARNAKIVAWLDHDEAVERFIGRVSSGTREMT